MSITKDATKGWARPISAAEWTELLAGTGIANPDSAWPCTEGSGNLADVIGSLTLTAVGTVAYGQSATGWAGGGVTAADNTTDGFRAAAGVGPDPSTTSQVWLFVLAIQTEPTGTRVIGGINVSAAASSMRAEFAPAAGTNKLQARCLTVTAAGTLDHSAGDYVIVLRYDRAASVAKVYSDLESIATTYASGVLDGNKGLNRQNALGSTVCMGIALWQGANGETLDDTKIATIRSRIESPPAGASVTFSDAVYPSNVERTFGPERSARRESYFGQPTPFPPLPSYADAVYAVPPMRRRSQPGASAVRPSTFAPVLPPAAQPVYADAVYSTPPLQHRPQPQRSAAFPSYFGPVSPPPSQFVFFDAVTTHAVRRLDAARSALRPSFHGPVDRPYLPDKDGTIPQTQYRQPHRYRSRSHLRPSYFGPPLLIADTPVTPIGPAGAATFAMNVESKATLTMSWATDIMKAWSGLEQRVALLRWPRLRFDFVAKLTDAQQRAVLSALAGDSSAAPVFLLGLAYEDLTVVSSSGPAITVNTLARCDWAQPGRRAVVVSPTGSTVDGVIQSASGVAITMTTNLSATAVPGARILPVSPIYLEPEQQTSRHRVALTEWQIGATAERPFAVPTMGVGATVNTFDGLPIWDAGISLETAAQPLRSGVDVLDLGGRISRFANFRESDWGRAIRMEGKGAADWQWLKAFLDAVRGRQMPFLLPTGRPDLAPVGDASGGTLTVVGSPAAGSPDYVTDWFPSLAHRRLRLLKSDATSAYRIVSGAIDNGNGTQTLTLDSPLVGALSRVEFLETCRLDSDDVSVTFETPRFSADVPALVVQR